MFLCIKECAAYTFATKSFIQSKFQYFAIQQKSIKTYQEHLFCIIIMFKSY